MLMSLARLLTSFAVRAIPTTRTESLGVPKDPLALRGPAVVVQAPPGFRGVERDHGNAITDARAERARVGLRKA